MDAAAAMGTAHSNDNNNPSVIKSENEGKLNTLTLNLQQS
jgi:hypothetical protein